MSLDFPWDHLHLWYTLLLFLLLSSSETQHFWATPVSSCLLVENLPDISFCAHLCLSPSVYTRGPVTLQALSLDQALSSHQFPFPIAHKSLWYLALPPSPARSLFLSCNRRTQICRTSAEQMFWEIFLGSVWMLSGHFVRPMICLPKNLPLGNFVSKL